MHNLQMASPAAVQAAITLSVLSTGGAMYYYLSEGGNSEVARDNVIEAKKRLLSESERLQAEAAKRIEQTKVAFGKAYERALEFAPTVLKDDASNIPKQDKNANKEAGSENAVVRHSENPDYQFCHTCGGPRIWFFAEKLRLKRRFTPYPDPPRE